MHPLVRILGTINVIIGLGEVVVLSYTYKAATESGTITYVWYSILYAFILHVAPIAVAVYLEIADHDSCNKIMNQLVFVSGAVPCSSYFLFADTSEVREKKYELLLTMQLETVLLGLGILIMIPILCKWCKRRIQDHIEQLDQIDQIEGG